MYYDVTCTVVFAGRDAQGRPERRMYDGDGHVVARHGQADPTERDDDGRNLTDRENPGHRRRQGENHRREFVVRLK